MIILTELVFYYSPVILLHGTSSHVMPVVEASSRVMPVVEANSHVMPARAGAMAGIYGCSQLFQPSCLEAIDSAAIETS